MVKSNLGDDEHLFESILDKQSDKIEENRQKFRKAKELLAAARDENQDIQREFEREREDFLDTIRVSAGILLDWIFL